MDTHRKNSIEDQKEHNIYQEIPKADQEIYDFLDRNFEKENNDNFSLGFSKKIIRKIEEKQQRRFNVKIYYLIAILVLISTPLFVSFLTTEFISMLFLVVLKHKFIICFLISMVILIQLGEKLINPKKDLH
ncbi:hypothetical protein ASG22_00955 [Chryseobacterium sp. Leaf405]|uniref:hypothetical protein n=1 Tax=Chryseobacterium sp. Leaf405 TaxID=1736367 RepID=UPI0006F7EF37|nr:hypothetical protein [Chryseobacterium sp. Leaf405]KQT35625.1 hypothetical protein ASG22_00955 [Chryseobacterium sp. Leaf405]